MGFFSENTGLYFFSALLQANAAIFAIVGVYYIFKLQSHNSSISDNRNALLGDRGMQITTHDVLRFGEQPTDKKEDYIEKSPFHVQVKALMMEWARNEQAIGRIRKKIKMPTFLLSIAIVLNAIGLIFANYIHQLGENVEFYILILVLIYEIWILWITVRGILKAMDI